MFELDQAVNNWCQSVIGVVYGCTNNVEARSAELKDHLYCEIERFEAEGLSQEQAFNKATQQMGDAEELMAEYAKNKSAPGKLCLETRTEFTQEAIERNDAMLQKRIAKLMVGHSILFAAAMIGSALILSNTTVKEEITLMMITLWFGSYLLLNRFASAVQTQGRQTLLQAECAYLRNLFGLNKKAQ